MTTTLPRRQREALFLACHSLNALTIVKGLKPQAKALVKKGLLDENLRPTQLGWSTYAEYDRPLPWAEFIRRPDSYRYDRGAQSASGLITYLFGPRPEEVAAVTTITVPGQVLTNLGLPQYQRPEIVR